jgi:hypothetical protein
MVTAKNYREAWKCLRGWYRDYSEPISPPLSCDLIQTRSAFKSLYSAHPPPGPAIPIHVSPASVDDTSPLEKEIVSTIRKMPRRRSPGASGIRPEDFIRWKSKEPKAWDKLVWLVQHAFTTGRISQAMAIEILTLLPKNEYGKYRGIVLMEAITKLCGTIIHLRLQEAITFHSDIHAFRSGRGTSTAILEAKLLMQSAIEEGKILYQVFLDLSKAYDNLDRPRLLDILAAYGVGPRLRCLISTIWDMELCVPKLGGYFGKPFHPERGIRQGGPDSPTAFDIVLDCVLREWHSQMLERKFELVTAFYADDGRLGGFDAAQVQLGLDLYCDLFQRLGLTLNEAKTKFMVTYGRPSSCPESDDSYVHSS